MNTPYQDAQCVGQAAVRTTILDHAIDLLVTEGPAALTMRRLATGIGASTKVLYTMFGGKEGLADALYREGFARLRRAQQQVAVSGDPLDHLNQLGAAYRAHALTEPAYYRVMFEQAIPGYRPSAEALSAAETAFEASVAAVQACIDSRVFRPGDAYEISKLFWAAAHGAVSLEIAGHFPPESAARRYDTLMTAVGQAFLAERGQGLA
ncbi:TetR/AcrR family transcriptional regulator [Streptomyces roseoverticillatus]|uniref:TetR/AcrR family transcriptional regulator n=1 Tax=Streptomyces roseoverticillatus TaxID=66429 RepID=UPI001F470BC2|nr:TetR/AcrR family transcriptional regulator [Streptomyces roseoverticillatus]MCF3102319.1 TetR/AcrR family transcriptional regulator [Streptomyces roseoverticillatus]